MPIGIQKLLALYAITVFAFAVVLALPRVAQAIGIGEVVLKSGLGEPLLAQVDLMVGSNERIDDSCLSLSAPDSNEDDTSGYLTKANLSLKIEGKRQYVVISSRIPFNDAFAKLRLQVKCPGIGSIIKTLVILPELEAPTPQAAAPTVSAEIKNIVATIPSDPHGVIPTENPSGTRNTPPEIEKYIAHKVPQHVKKHHSQSKETASSKQGYSPSFILRLSDSPMEESRIGKISTEERTVLLAQQKLLDADDQTARFLAMQHQLKQLQDELAAIKLQLAQLGDSPSSHVSSSAPLVVGAQENHLKPGAENVAALASTLAQSAIAVRPAKPAAPNVVAPPPSLLNEILGEPLYWLGGATALLGLGGIGFIFVRRRIKDGSVGKDKDTVNISSTRITTPIAPSPDTGDFTHIASATPIRLAEPDDVDPLIEADLLLDFGRNEQAEETLKNVLNNNPGNQQIRIKLLSIYADRKDAHTFAAVAVEVRDSGDVNTWTQVAEMGRKLDPGNPLYGGNDIKETTEIPQNEITITQPTVSLDFDLDFGVAEVGTTTLDMPLDATNSVLSGLDFEVGSTAPTEFAPAAVAHDSLVVLAAAKEANVVDQSELNLNLDVIVPTHAPEKVVIEPTKTAP